MKGSFWVWVILFFAVALRYVSPDQTEERLIVPDGVEYAVSAVNLIEGKGYQIFIGGIPYPPRYPFGYPLCLAPFYFFLGGKLGNGIFCSLFFSLGTILLSFLLAQKLFGKQIALWATLFLTVSPLHIYWSRVIMADIPSCFITLCVLWILFSGDITPKRLFWVGALLGVDCWFKYLNLFWLPVFFLFLISRKEKKQATFYGTTAFLSGAILSLIPLFLYHQFVFGSPFRTGYSFWVPEWSRLKNAFEITYAFHQPPLPVHQKMPNLLALGQFLLGIGFPWMWNPYPFLLVPFIGIGIWKILQETDPHSQKRKEFLFLCLLATGVSYGFSSLYFAPSPRFLLSVVPLLVTLAAIGVNALFNRWPKRFQNGILLLSAWTLLISPFLLNRVEGKSRARKSYVQLVKRNTMPDAFVITEWDPVSFYHEIQKGSKRTYIPISKELEYVHRPFRPDPKREIPFRVASQELEFLEKIVLSRGPVYLDGLSCENYLEECRALRKKFRFREIAFQEGVRLYQLESRKAEF